MASKYGYFSEATDRLRMIAYVTNKRVVTNSPSRCREFCEQLMMEHEYDVAEIFMNSNMYHHPVLEVVSLYLFKYSGKNVDHLAKINQTLVNCNLEALLIKEEHLFLENNFKNDSPGEFVDGFNKDMTVRKRHYYKITRDNIFECRFIAHFLLDHRTVEEIYRDEDEVNERLHKVLLAWEYETKEMLKTLENLNGVLQMLQNPVGSGHVTSTQDAQPRYHLCYNATHNVVARVAFYTEVTEVRISKNHTCQATQELKRNKDYHEFISSLYWYFIFEDGVLREDNHISFNWSNKEGINLQLVTQALSDLINYHSSELHTPHILVKSHNNICKAIELLLQKISYPENIWYNGGGGKRVEISYKDWLEHICLDYAREYFGHPKENALKEVLLFPPYYIVNDKFSQILNWATSFLKQEYGVGAVIWQYDLIEYFHFLRLQDSLDFDRLGCCQNRILVICPTPLTIFNIRYTEACDINSVVHELTRGEQDITYFCIAHKDSLLSTQITLINTVAAPNFSDNNLICRECSVANKEMLATADSFAHFLRQQITSENTEDVEKDETVLKIVGFITAFMAIKETFTYNHAICRVPTLSKEVTEQVKSMLMLNPSQLKVINSKKSKKIVLGNFGSGKSLVGVYQLQYLMLSARKETVIYFIAWSEKSVLVHHIRRLIASFFQMDSLDMKEGNFQMKKASSYVTQINDLMVQFNLQKVPSLSYLLSVLFERHYGKQVHVVIDEYDGEVLDREEAEKINHFCQREEVKKSCILVIPHSLEKHRTYVKSGKTLQHDKYQYEHTGMEIFRLKKVLRTTKRIHEVVKTFQEKVCHTKKVFKHQLSEEDVSPNTDETQFIFVENELDQFSAHKLHECDLKVTSNVKTSLSTELSKEEKEERGPERQEGKGKGKGKGKGRDVAGGEKKREGAREEGVGKGEGEEREEEGEVGGEGEGGGIKIDEGKEEEARAGEDGKRKGEESITSGNTRSCFTKPKMHKSVDFDYLANSIDEIDCSDDVRTETSFSYPHCHLIGHKIEGETPKFIAYIRWPDSDAEKITQMAIALKRHLLDVSNKLVLAQTDHNRYLFEKAFDLINLDYYTCCCSTDWQVRDKKGEMVSIMSEPYTLITNYEGCRGLEAEEVVVCIDGVHDLNQVFIEHCSRSTGRLLIMCQQPFDLKHAVHSTMCDTMMMLFKKNMIHLIVVETKMDENTTRNCHSKLEEWSDEKWVEIDERKKDSLCREVVQINTSEDTAYRRYLDQADEFEKYVGREEMVINLKSLIRKRLEPPFPAKDLRVYSTNDNTCTLSWRNDHFEYTLQIAEPKNSKHPKWRDIATAISYSELIVKGLQNESTYNFRVLSTSSFGSVASNIVTYHSRESKLLTNTNKNLK